MDSEPQATRRSPRFDASVALRVDEQLIDEKPPDAYRLKPLGELLRDVIEESVPSRPPVGVPELRKVGSAQLEEPH